jgi:SSS family solute:Na+ symporter
VQGIEIATIDLVLVVVYFFLVFGVGSFFGKFVKSTGDFFFGGRKFAWWVVSLSMIATVVGSYSFIKYSQAGYTYGMSSSMSYLNDWFFIPLWMFGWLPIIYYCRITSVPEYFERRFDTPTRVMAILFITLYLVGYIGINFFTLGVALNALYPAFGVFEYAIAVAVITAIYVTSGGQTAVIMTDLFQGIVLLFAGFAILYLGFAWFGDGNVIEGAINFWYGLPEEKRYGLAHFNDPPSFNFVGVFWQDAIASTFAAYFFNQGMLMRFLSLKSVHEGRKALAIAFIVLFPIAVIAVGNAGWIGAAMHNLGIFPAGYPQDPDPGKVFVIVTHILAQPGVFGLIMAALLAALMSTADTLINATSAVVVNDIWRPYVVTDREDHYYLNVARYASIAAAAIGLALVPTFMEFESIYVAHGAFVATVGPPMAACTLLGFTWKRFTPRAAFATLLGGAIAMLISLPLPDVLVAALPGIENIFGPAIIEPISHGVDPEGNFKYMRAAYGFATSAFIGIVVTFFTKPNSDEKIFGLTMHTVRKQQREFKGGDLNLEIGEKVDCRIDVVPDEAWSDDGHDQSRLDDETIRLEVSMHPDDLELLQAKPGDLIYMADTRWWFGGLRAAHARVKDAEGQKGVIRLPESFVHDNSLVPKRPVRVELIM